MDYRAPVRRLLPRCVSVTSNRVLKVRTAVLGVKFVTANCPLSTTEIH